MGKSRLQSGLSSIYGDDLYDVINDIEKKGSSTLIAIDKIRVNPYQPRTIFDENGIEELAQSIQTHGLFTPILVREAINGYELIAGERRLRACKKLKMTEISAIIVDFNDQQMMEISLLENIQRENLSVIEEAHAYQKLIDNLHYTQEELSKRVNKSRAHIANLLRLLNLPSQVQDMVSNEQLTFGHVRALITINDDNKTIELARRAIDEQMSVRQVEQLVKKLKEEPHKLTKDQDKDKYSEVIKVLNEYFVTDVDVDDKKIVIKYSGTNDLNRILEKLGCLVD
ncbi:MAG: ParB/RepB/Spo0J family partition protein [Erysipelotrichaceae bacterium]